MPLATLTNLNKIQWHEGMLLSPQHFQYGELRIEQLLYANAQNSAYCNWGVLDFAIDKNLLAQGIVEVSQLLAILPDGTIILHNSELYNENTPP
jgi:type VI secretion system protein ImpJ